MKNTVLLIVLCIVCVISTKAQNVWTGSSISTQTNGNVGIGASPYSTYKLRVHNTSNSQNGLLYLYQSNNVSGTKYGLRNYNNIKGNGSKYSLYNYSSFNGTGNKYGIYNYVYASGSGNKYGIYSNIAGGTGTNYGIYSKASGSGSYAGFFEGKVHIKNNDIELYNVATNSKVLLHNSWNSAGEAFFSIIHAEDNGNYEFEKSLTFFRTGELKKEIDDANKDAFYVDLYGDKNFVVKGSGYVYAREVEVTLDPFPDYVFESDYDLMPLDHLKNYINENKHLPNIPSAKEIEKEGIGLGELSIKEMEKIEELTLYIIQISDRLKEVEAKNKTLSEKLEALTNQ